MCDDTVSFKKIDYICINKYNGFCPKRHYDVRLGYFAIGEYKNRRYVYNYKSIKIRHNNSIR